MAANVRWHYSFTCCFYETNTTRRKSVMDNQNINIMKCGNMACNEFMAWSNACYHLVVLGKKWQYNYYHLSKGKW